MVVDGLRIDESSEVADRRKTRSSRTLHASRIWLVLCELGLSVSSWLQCRTRSAVGQRQWAKKRSGSTDRPERSSEVLSGSRQFGGNDSLQTVADPVSDRLRPGLRKLRARHAPEAHDDAIKLDEDGVLAKILNAANVHRARVVGHLPQEDDGLGAEAQAVGMLRRVRR